jgi:hypothetical protein
MKYDEVKRLVFDVAVEMAKKGPGWAQQNAVLWEVANRLGTPLDPRAQQLVLTCWHDLFRDGRLSWGLNIDNPDLPFYHIPEPEPQRELVG